jgi:hypothetical protein
VEEGFFVVTEKSQSTNKNVFVALVVGRLVSI